jgi:hypothetical protein
VSEPVAYRTSLSSPKCRFDHEGSSTFMAAVITSIGAQIFADKAAAQDETNKKPS